MKSQNELYYVYVLEEKELPNVQINIVLESTRKKKVYKRIFKFVETGGTYMKHGRNMKTSRFSPLTRGGGLGVNRIAEYFVEFDRTHLTYPRQ